MSRQSRFLAYLLTGVTWTTPQPLEVHVALTFFIFSLFEMLAWLNALHVERLDAQPESEEPVKPTSVVDAAVKQDDFV